MYNYLLSINDDKFFTIPIASDAKGEVRLPLPLRAAMKMIIIEVEVIV